MSDSGSDLSPPKHRGSAQSRRTFTADPSLSRSKSSPSELFSDAHDYAQTPHGSPLTSGAQDGFSWPAWPTAACDTIEEDVYALSTPVNISRRAEEAFPRSSNPKVPPPAKLAPRNANAVAQPRQQERDEQEQQEQQDEQEPEPEPELEQEQQQQQEDQQHQEQCIQQRQRKQHKQEKQEKQDKQKQKQQHHKHRQKHKQQKYTREDDGRGECCQAKNCQERPTYSEDGHKPAEWCQDHRKDGMFRVQHGNKTCGVDGCTRNSEVNYMDQNTKIYRFCAQHKEPPVVLEQATRCKHGGCDGTPRYGTRDGPLNFCQAHKRVGLFTTRDGELYVATRDGSAFRRGEEDGNSAAGIGAAGCAATAKGLEIAIKTSTKATTKTATMATSQSSKTAKSREGSTTSPSSTGDTNTAPSSTGKTTSLSRKLCEVPGCKIQPSYGEAGSSKPRFCFGHKEKTHISLKNRPCEFPGCVIRPHYGPSRGRAVFCVTHKKKSHVHLLKEAEQLEKEENKRKRHGKSPTTIVGKKGRLAGSKGKEKEQEKDPKKQGKGKGPADALAHDKHKRDEQPKGKGKEKDKEKANEKDKDKEKDKGKGKGKDEEEGKGKGKGKAKGQAKEKGSARPVAAAVDKASAAAGKKPAAAAKNQRDVASGGDLRAPESAASLSAAPAQPSSSSSARSTAAAAVAAPTTTGHGSGAALTVNLPRAAEPPPGMILYDIDARPRQEHGVSPRAEGDGSGSGGRRARAPSRKLLEAVGRVADEGAQLLTREKKEQEARLKMEMREQRRAAKTAGLRLGQVIEATAVPVSSSGGEVGSESGGASWESDKSGAFSVSEALPSNLSWRKLSPAETLLAAQQEQQKQATMEEAKRSLAPAGDTQAEAKVGAGTAGKRGRPGTVSPSVATAAAAATAENGNNADTSKKRKETAPSSPAPSPRHGSTGSDNGEGGDVHKKRARPAKGVAEVGSKEHGEQANTALNAAKRRSSRGQGEGERTSKPSGGKARGKIACELEGCDEPASYGIGDTVRYCKKHKIATGL